MTTNRNFFEESQDQKQRQYFYGFDYDVMHPYMLKTFLPYIKPGSLLELGSFQGEFTKRLVPFFSNITCVEASIEALEIAKKLIGNKAKYYNEVFEEVNLPTQYDHVVMTHVLEHLDDPVKVLTRINKEWLAPNGRLFLVVPNAHAPSRQIAVSMGLINDCATVTEAEAKHGHRITYSFDTLERDVRQSGLKIVAKSGIFFKAMANYQWDQILKTDIVTPAYLDGCYNLGLKYPDLCSSIFLLCERNE